MIEINPTFLTEIRRKAIRKRIWYKTLTQAERAILNLVPKCVKKPKSPKLIDIIAKIIVKIQNALKSKIITLRNQIGRPLAKKISQIAQKWGYNRAKEWAEDPKFIQYLTIIKINDIPIFR